MPQGGVLFCSMDHEHQVILDKIEEAFPGIELIGCTTDGEVSSDMEFQEDSVVLAVFDADGIEFRAGLGQRMSEGVSQATQQAMDQATSRCTLEPRLCITTPDSLTASGVSVVDALQAVLGVKVPILGGIAADQWEFKRTFQFCRGRVYSDAVPVLLFCGPLKFSFGVASGWKPIGNPATVTSSDHNVVKTIDGESAQDFFCKYLGPHAVPSSETPLAVFEDADGAGGFYLRAPLLYDRETGAVSFAGDVPEGACVALTQARREDILEGTSQSVRMARDAFPDEQPDAVIVFSCAARKQLLGTQTEREYKLLSENLPKDVPVAGFYAYGEISPLMPGHPTRFHNQTMVTLFLGTE